MNTYKCPVCGEEIPDGYVHPERGQEFRWYPPPRDFQIPRQDEEDC